jgi:hypothetical protein
VKRIAAFTILAGLGTVSYLRGAISSVHETVTFPGGKPSVISVFEQTRLSKTAQTCPFLTLNGDATKKEQAEWQSGVASGQHLMLTHLAPTAGPEGMRQDEADQNGRVRRSTWTWDNGMVHQVVLFDEKGQILQLDRWRNQRWVPDDLAPSFTCGNSVERSLAMRILNGVTRSGQTELQISALEDLADRTTTYSLTKDLGLTDDVCTPSGQKASETNYLPKGRVLTSNPSSNTVAIADVGRVSGTKHSISLNKPLVIAPNPALQLVEAFYRLDSEALVGLEIVNISGDTVATYSLGDQGAGVHSFSFEVNNLSSGVYIATLIANIGGGHKVMNQIKFAVKH